MSANEAADHYEILQISPNAEPDTIHRVYKLLAQRLHPDNTETGNAAAFRSLSEAYQIIGDPVSRAQYDVVYERKRQDRWRLVASGAKPENDFEAEQLVRLTVLEVLYTRRRTDAQNPGLTPLDIETLIGRAREHLEFTIWYLGQRKYLTRNDSSELVITADGVEFLETHYQQHLLRRRIGTGSDAPREVVRT